MLVSAAPSSTHRRVLPSARHRPLYLFARCAHALPRMTNHQVPEVTPEAWGKARQQFGALHRPQSITVSCLGFPSVRAF